MDNKRWFPAPHILPLPFWIPVSRRQWDLPPYNSSRNSLPFMAQAVLSLRTSCSLSSDGGGIHVHLSGLAGGADRVGQRMLPLARRPGLLWTLCC